MVSENWSFILSNCIHKHKQHWQWKYIHSFVCAFLSTKSPKKRQSALKGGSVKCGKAAKNTEIWNPITTTPLVPPITHLLVMERGHKRSVLELEGQLVEVAEMFPGSRQIPGDLHSGFLTFHLPGGHIWRRVGFDCGMSRGQSEFAFWVKHIATISWTASTAVQADA